MKMILNSLTIILVSASISCMQVNDAKKNLLSGDRDLIIETAIWIKEGNDKDTSIVVELLTHILDVRLSTSVTYYRQNPYMSRIQALEKITGLNSPYKIEMFANALIVDYYLDWALNKGYIKNKDDINVIPPHVEDITDSKSFIKNIRNNEKVSWLTKYKWERKPFGNRLHN